MTTARADYACLGKKCRTPEGEATVYELPLGSTRCPVCSSKRLQRLFTSAPMIGSGQAKQLDAFVRPSLDAAEAPKLKAQDGKNILKFGTGELDRTLLEHRLVDEFQFWLIPIVVGRGERLFEGVETTLELLDTTRFKSGVVALRYAPK